MAFDGNLIYLGSGNTPLPLSFIKVQSYKAVPNRRQDLDSTRNANGVLQRTVLNHYASTIEFQTVPMNNSTKNAFMNLMRSNYTSEKEKKMHMRYYCPDTDSYKEGDFYVPDVEFPIIFIDGLNIQYDSITWEFIEY